MAAKMPDLIAYGRRMEQGKKERLERKSSRQAPDLIAYGRRMEQGQKERSARSSQLAQTAEKKTALSPVLGQTAKSPVPIVGTGRVFTPVLGTAQGEKKDPALSVEAGWEKAKIRAVQRAGEQEAQIKRGFLPRAADTARRRCISG